VSKKEGVVGALVGIVSAITGAASGSSDVVNDYGRYSQREREAETSRTVETSVRTENTQPAGHNRDR
jgi:hypothetical protein